MQQDKILSALSDIARKKSSGGGGGAGDASAANQALQLAQETVSANKLALIEAKTPALVAGRVPVDGSGVTQPVSGTVSVTGVSTSANQTTANASLASIDGKIPVLVSGRQPVDGSGVTQPISATALPLPTGAATAANQATEITALGTLHTDLLAATPAGTNVIGKVDLNNTSFISTGNSTSATLGANAVFTGASEDISQYSEVRLTVFSDVASATDGLQFQQSSNNSNWDYLDSYSIPAGTGKTFGIGVGAQYFRVVYTNGATPQGSFRLQTTFKKLRTKPSSVRPQDGRTNDNDMEEMVAYHSIFNGTSWDRLRGDTTNGAWVNVKTGVLTETNSTAILAKLPSPGQAAASASQPVVLTSDQMFVNNINDSIGAFPVQLKPIKKFRASFSSTKASGWDTRSWLVVQTGTGMATSQATGNGVLTSGTTANSETIIRSTQAFNDSFVFKYRNFLSQRIANNNFYAELVDVVGDALAMTINSTTSVTVTIPVGLTTYRPFIDPTGVNTNNNWYYVFSSLAITEYVGQGIFIGGTGLTTTPPMRATIASVSVNVGVSVTLTLTVAGWPASGTGNCSLFGYNFFQTLYTGTTATQASVNTQKNGWLNTSVTATVNTTATPGHIGIWTNEDSQVGFIDQLTASATGQTTSARSQFSESLPSQDCQLYIQMRAVNGTSAPATTTTWNVTFVGFEDYMSQKVTIGNISPMAPGSPLPAQILGGTLGTVTTVTTVSTVSAATISNGQTAHSSAATGTPVRIGGIIVPTTIATVETGNAAGEASNLPISSGYQVVTKDFSTSELDGYTPVLPSVTSTAIQSIVAASGTASVRNYITQVSIQTDTLGAAGNMFIVDNQGAIGTSVTIATPGVFTSTAHDLRVGDTIIFTSLGTITGVSTNTMYYVTATSLAATTFTVALTPGGTAIQITGSTSAFTFYRVFYMFRLNTSAITTPFVINPVNPYKGIANSNLNVYFPVSLLTGTVYINVNGYRGF